MAWLAALGTYAVAVWSVRFFLTVLTLPLAGLLRSPRPLPTLRAMSLVASGACGVGGFLAAGWVLARFGQNTPLLLGALLVAGTGAAHAWGLRRLASGPQLFEESFSLVGEELGLLAGVALRLLA